MKVIVILPMRGQAQEPRLVQFILETEQEMERFANFYAKNNPTIAALLDVLLGKTQPPEEPQPPKTINLQIEEGAVMTDQAKPPEEKKDA